MIDAKAPGSFAEQPVSVGEARAARKADGSLWTPRDALVSLLREIDAGEVNCDALVICYREILGPGPGNSRTTYRNASPDATTSIGLVEQAKLWMFASGRGER